MLPGLSPRARARTELPVVNGPATRCPRHLLIRPPPCALYRPDPIAHPIFHPRPSAAAAAESISRAMRLKPRGAPCSVCVCHKRAVGRTVAMLAAAGKAVMLLRCSFLLLRSARAEKTGAKRSSARDVSRRAARTVKDVGNINEPVSSPTKPPKLRLIPPPSNFSLSQSTRLCSFQC